MADKGIPHFHNDAGVAVTAASITDPTGAATLDAEVWQGLPAGVYAVEAYFGSVVALDDGATINLLDDRFQASEAAATAAVGATPSSRVWLPLINQARE